MESKIEYQISVSKPNSGEIVWINNGLEEPKIYDIDNKYIRVKTENSDEELIENKLKKMKLEDINNNVEQKFNIIEKENIFNERQMYGIKVIIKNILKIDDGNDLKSYITLTGGAGSGKSYTILNMFKYFTDIFKNFSICFCAPTNVIVQRCKEYESYISPYFAKTNYFTISQLLGERMMYDNNGNQVFRRCKKNIPLNEHDIIIIDESSMIGDEKIQQILKEYINNQGICIFIGDKNQLNPVNETENKILYNSHINLLTNMRCSKKLLNKIFDFIIREIEICNSMNINYKVSMYNNFVGKLLEYINKKQNGKTLIYYDNEEQFINKFIDTYGSNDSIICNYTNKECKRLNNIIKDIVIDKYKIKIVDNKYYVGQQLIFNKRYELNGYSTSEIVKLDSIEMDEYKFKYIKIEDLYNINTEDTHFNIIISDFEYFNNIIFEKKIYNDLNKVIKVFNKYDDMGAYKLYIYNKNHPKDKTNYIYTLKSQEETIYNKFIESIKRSIEKLNRTYENDKIIGDYIISALYKLLDKYRVNVFADINYGYNSTIHKIQGISISYIFVNLTDINTMSNNDLKNKLKLIYTSFTRCSKCLVIFKN